MRALLTHYNWDKERLLEKFYEYEGNQDRIFKDAHIINPFKRPSKLKASLHFVKIDINIFLFNKCFVYLVH